MKIITRYILKELLGFFILSFLIFSTLFMFTNIYKIINMIIGQGASAVTIIKLFALYIPASFQLTIPMSIMIAILMTLGRMAADSEIIVLRACGVSIRKISKPVYIFAVLMTLVNFYSINYLSPASMYKARLLIHKIVSGSPVFTFTENNPVIISGKKIKVEKIDGNELFNIMVIDEFKNIITAQSGIIEHIGNSLNLTLNDGYLEKPSSEDLGQYDRNKFGALILKIPLPENQYEELRRKRDDELSFFELNRTLKKSKEITPKRLIDLYMKLSIPFACIAFTFIGLPIGLTARKTGKAVGFTWGILSIFVYYLLFSGVNAAAYGLNSPDFILKFSNILNYIPASLFTVVNMSKNEVSANPMLMIKYIVWLPNIIICIAGVIIYKKFVMNKL